MTEEHQHFCAEHELVKNTAEKTDELVKTSTPRWFFVLAVTILLAFNGVIITYLIKDLSQFKMEYSAHFEQFKMSIDTRLVSIESHLQNRIQISRELYKNDSDRNYKLLMRLVEAQKQLEKELAVVATKQDAVFKKLDLR